MKRSPTPGRIIGTHPLLYQETAHLQDVTIFSVMCLYQCRYDSSISTFKYDFLKTLIHASIASCLLAASLISACGLEPVNAVYDDDDIRELAYRTLFTQLRLDTLDCGVMAVTHGDSLSEGLFWPGICRPHSLSLLKRLGDLPMRIVAMDDIDKLHVAHGKPVWRSRDSDEIAVACFTGNIERVDETRLLVLCGMYFTSLCQAYGACDLVYDGSMWKVRALQFYFKSTR